MGEQDEREGEIEKCARNTKKMTKHIESGRCGESRRRVGCRVDISYLNAVTIVDNLEHFHTATFDIDGNDC